MKKLKQLATIGLALLIVVAVVLPLGSQALAEPLPQVDQDALNLDTPHWVTTPSCSNSAGTTSTGAVASGGKVYMLGDSITVRTQSLYAAGFQAKGITMNMSAVSGRSWNSAGNPAVGSAGTQGPAKTAVDTDASMIKEANGIVIALGTNGYTSGNPIDEIYTKIRSLNPTAPIWWVNIATTNKAVPGVADFNSKLAQASSGKFTVIDWAKTVDPSGDGTNDPNHILDDGTHPVIGKGTQALADLVVSSVTGAPSAATPAPTAPTTGSCSCPASTSTGPGVVDKNGTDSEKVVFDYLLSVGFTAVQAAGITGNFKAESGFNPAITNSIGAHGLAQWLGGRLDHLRSFAQGKGLDPDTLNAQLLFVSEELGTKPKFADADAAVRATTSVADAATKWDAIYEVSGGSSDPARIQFGNDALTKYGSDAPAGVSGGGSCNKGVSTTTTIYTYEDASRGRKLATTVIVPNDAGTYPVVLFAHGFQKGPDAYSQYLTAIASKGFIVAAPSFPNADEHGILPLNRNDSMPQQPADLKFVLDKILTEPQLTSKIKSGAIGLVGHSDGAIAALMDGYSDQKDPRLKVVVAISADDISGKLGSGPPLLQMHGDKDTTANHDGDFNNYKKINANPKYFFTLIGAAHCDVAATCGDDTEAMDALMTGFLDQILNGKPDTMKTIAEQYSGKVKQE